MGNLVVFGTTGQLGRALGEAKLPRDWTLHAFGRAEADVTSASAVETALSQVTDAVAVVNATAYTAVDRAETEPDTAFAVNGQAPGILARACARRDLPFVHVSTDYVFDGSMRPGGWQEDDPVAPLGVYGRSKEEGERAALAAGGRVTVLRTSWVFSPFGGNFVKTMLRLAQERPELRVVADQIGRPTAASTIAAAALVILDAQFADPNKPAGCYHVADEGETSWHGFAEAIVRGYAAATGAAPPTVVPITTAEYPTPARRPANSVLDTRRLARVYGFESPAWHDTLRACLATLLPAGSKESTR